MASRVCNAKLMVSLSVWCNPKEVKCGRFNHEDTVNRIPGDNIHQGTVVLGDEIYTLSWTSEKISH